MQHILELEAWKLNLLNLHSRRQVYQGEVVERMAALVEVEEVGDDQEVTP